MITYRLKHDAKYYVDKRFHTKIEGIEFWKELGLNSNAIEETERIFITYGTKTSPSTTDLCGWESEGDKVFFKFTINILDISDENYRKLKEANRIGDIMALIQTTINEYLEHENI